MAKEMNLNQNKEGIWGVEGMKCFPLKGKGEML